MTGNRKKLSIGVALIVTFILLPCVWVFSSTGVQDPVQAVFKRIEQMQNYVLERKLKTALALSDPQVSQLKAILKDNNSKRSSVIRARMQIVDQIEAGKLKDADLASTLVTLDSLDDQFFDLEKNRRAELRAVLNTDQKAKFTLMRREMLRKVMRVLKPLL